MSNVNKFLLAVVLIVAIGGFVYWSSSQGSTAATVNTTPISSDTIATNTSSGSNPPTTAQTNGTGQYKDGTYTGSAANSIYGNIQVSATIASGKLTDVTFLAYPNSQPHSVDVSNMSMPILKTEAITSQSASVDIVSGATQTSEAFMQSLQSALSQAANS